MLQPAAYSTGTWKQCYRTTKLHYTIILLNFKVDWKEELSALHNKYIIFLLKKTIELKNNFPQKTNMEVENKKFKKIGL